jgi:hypothetical protein
VKLHLWFYRPVIDSFMIVDDEDELAKRGSSGYKMARDQAKYSSMFFS